MPRPACLYFNPRPPCGGRHRGCWRCGRSEEISIHVLRVEDDVVYFFAFVVLRCISIHVLRVEDDTHRQRFLTRSNQFQSTSSVWRTTMSITKVKTANHISIHVLRVEDDDGRDEVTVEVLISIHVLRVEDDKRNQSDFYVEGDFNPRPPCGGRHPAPKVQMIQQHFNPRPPCGGRPWPPLTCGGAVRFQSTSSVWRTTHRVEQLQLRLHISIHVLRVEDDSKNREKSLFALI